MGQYKNETTSYVLKDIPLDTWKSLKLKLVEEDIPSANSLLLFLVKQYLSGSTKPYAD